MATHSSVLAWRIPGTGEPGGLLSVGSHRVGYDCSGLAAAVGRWRRVKIHLPLGHLLLSHCSVLARMPGVSTEDRGPDQASLFTQVITLPPGPVLSLSLQFSHSVVSNSLRPHGLKHPGFPVCHQLPEPAHTHVYLVGWMVGYHPTISSSVIPFSSFLQSFPASGSFQMSQLFASGGQSIGVSASASVLLMYIQD